MPFLSACLSWTVCYNYSSDQCGPASVDPGQSPWPLFLLRFGCPLIGQPNKDVLERLISPNDEWFEQLDAAIVDGLACYSHFPLFLLPRAQSADIAELKWTALGRVNEKPFLDDLG